MSAELMLKSTEPSLLIIEERKRKDIVIGVPHHAPSGIPNLPCSTHPDADENAGFLGLYIAKKLNCCSIIACNYKVDVNKYFRTDYTMQIASWNPKVLIEIHGHGGKKAKFNIEISSGSPENDKYSKSMADNLKTSFSTDKDLNTLSISGEYSEIHFKASDSVTITDGRWIPYHIELPPSLRKPEKNGSGKPAVIGYKFCDYLFDEVIKQYGE